MVDLVLFGLMSSLVSPCENWPVFCWRARVVANSHGQRQTCGATFARNTHS